MAFKPRTERQELIILRSLNARMELPDVDKRNFYNLKKGYEGEVMFDSLTEKIQSNCYVLNDLLLEVNNNKFQIDTLIIKDTLHIFDVKNNEGNYYYENGEFYSKKNDTKITTNPLDQLKRCDSLFHQLLQKHGFRIPVESNVVFINPEFTLYQAPKNKPLIFPTQLNSLFKKLNTPTRNLTNRHKQLAELLDSLHQVDSPYPRLLKYEFGQLDKGLSCCTCQSLRVSVRELKATCDDCGAEEEIESAVLRSVMELKLLFPDINITTNLVYVWCRVISKKTIRRILKKHFKAINNRRNCYYE
ncbi:nuclease-related domain-containing protein [Neobacillus sp. PS2-9]|uniref:nuclease-related domain-containing protein n=1 Tax=Neobacillus sp. PS2-9 TaxID=3070676 RepID=UPI0027E15991|nr:nuclease-related domain-containing protein [Neobacillus sp. PS2-9]WML59030.1 nuclease-related domain-containing protein [Neobacillus sp. PS2-9]